MKRALVTFVCLMGMNFSTFAAAQGWTQETLKPFIADLDPEAVAEARQLIDLSLAAYGSIDALVRADLSCQASVDCTAIALGSRACGGPNGYVVVSKTNMFVANGVVQLLATDTTSIEKSLNYLLGVGSICAYEMPPATACVAKVCTKIVEL
jgi:hypothetical protein